MSGLRTLRRRLDALRREGRSRSAPAVVFRRGLARRRPRHETDGPPPPPSELPAGEVVETTHGRAYVIDTREAAPPGLGDTDGLYFDIEATGLSSMPLFLIGCLRIDGDRLEIRQLLARDYSEEAAVIALFEKEAAGVNGLVSFNGKSYDLPYTRSRAAATGVPFDVDPGLPHRDLLHECRRAYKDRLPNCRLATLEREVLHQPRGHDLPGSEVPEAYHAWVRTGAAGTLVEILRHNHRDLVSMAALVALLPEREG